MAAVNFPNPNATNPETGEPYSAGWTADNGVTYIYEDNSWKADSIPGPAADDKYVNVDGDNMTGNLTLGTDKITLNASDGSASFGKVGIRYSGDPTNSDYILGFTGGGTDLGFGIEQQNVLGFYHDGTQVASIDLTGAATFAGGVELTSASNGLVVSGQTDFSNSIQVYNGSDQVALIKGDGSATFAGEGRFSADDTSPGEYYWDQTTFEGVALGNGFLTAARKGDVSLLVNFIDNGSNESDLISRWVRNGGAAAGGVDVIDFKKDGSASFAGGGTFGSSVKVQFNGSDRVILAPTGGNTFYKNTSTDSIIARFGNQTGAENIVLNSGGSATFAGSIRGASWDSSSGSGTGYFIGATGGLYVRRTSTALDTDTLFAGYKGDGNSVVEFQANGSAHFAGATAFGANASTSSVVKDTNLIISGTYQARREPNENIFVAINDDNGTPGVLITAGGSAEFAGGQFKIYDSGAVDIYRTVNDPSLGLFKLKSNVGANEATVVNVLADGSATFAGNLITGGDPNNGENVGSVMGATGGLFGCRANDNEVIFATFKKGVYAATSSILTDGTITGKNVTFNLEPENPANYTTTTVDGEEQQVYNGPTLDVKERLTKADTALQTLKTAAAAAVDFAELKAAIATALADI